MKVQILTDNPGTWIIPYVKELVQRLTTLGCQVNHVYEHNEVVAGDVLCLLSCEKKFTSLELNTYNLVVHESALPEGKGWSPLTWQVLEGKNHIPISLIEATDKIDSGKIYLQREIILEGTELVDELRLKQGNATIELIEEFVKNITSIKGVEQSGVSTYYNKRTLEDSRLDINKTILEQFNLLRVCDNERYPSHFYIDGKKYIIKIFKE